MEESERNEGFKISDRRRFTPGGEVKSEADGPEKETKSPEAGTPIDAKAGPVEEAPKSESSSSGKAKERQAPLPPVDFNVFVFSLANSALVQLGLVKLPGASEESTKDLQGARHTIDLIALLEEKTRGNLTDEEKKVLAETLFQLRMAYVEAAK